MVSTLLPPIYDIIMEDIFMKDALRIETLCFIAKKLILSG